MSESHFSKDGICTFLRRAFPSATALNVSALTGVSPSTIDNWLRGDTAPSAAHVGALVAAFGPSFLSVAYPVAQPWLDGQVKHDRIKAAIAELETALAGLGS